MNKYVKLKVYYNAKVETEIFDLIKENTSSYTVQDESGNRSNIRKEKNVNFEISKSTYNNGPESISYCQPVNAEEWNESFVDDKIKIMKKLLVDKIRKHIQPFLDEIAGLEK